MFKKYKSEKCGVHRYSVPFTLTPLNKIECNQFPSEDTFQCKSSCSLKASEVCQRAFKKKECSREVRDKVEKNFKAGLGYKMHFLNHHPKTATANLLLSFN
ncbi:hypothetical protein ATANTOWER_000190 [Ataeniobius toweri]|uniref:Uncharacterized protein n=1 Tax=Ataeniobius toweri TaxID=208326 RepID=A0ABU7C4R0_9TELE|nr:hypothetical protein [Ataeniobius toweri]